MTRAGNVCLISAGAQVTLATSSDERHPAENIVDGNPDTFWTSTGMFPQEFVISLSGIQKINKIILQSSQIRSLRIETSTSKEPMHFESCVERDLDYVEGQLQNEEFPIPGVQTAQLRFVILSGYDHFVSVHSVSAEGGV
ncbi:intraflagellar transport protein 25 homolog [Rhinophrynus dorsalis]